MAKDARSGTGEHLRRLVARAAGTVALGAAGLALGVTLAGPSVAAEGGSEEQVVRAVDGPRGSALTDTLGATTRLVTATTDLLGLTATHRTPGAAAPDAEAAVPDTAPDGGAPDAPAPEADEPGEPAADPDGILPDVDLPEGELPDVELPDVELPD